MSFLQYMKGKARAVCTATYCGWQSRKFEVEGDAYMALAHHNYHNHPARYPRWNPDIKAIEKEFRNVTRKGSLI